jgi:RNA polymerase sigma factor (sigma-70 family)
MRFPTTTQSALLAVRSANPVERARSFATLARAYYRPVYALLRVKWRKGPTEAEDLCQAFFAFAFEKHVFGGYDPSRGRFRTYVRALLDHFVARVERSARRLKRGGGAVNVRFDFAGGERELAAAGDADPETLFERAWARQLVQDALAALRAECDAAGRQLRYRLLERYDLSDADPRPSYAELARELSISVADVTNHLHYARRDLRRHVIARLREITASDEELAEELAHVLGDAE